MKKLYNVLMDPDVRRALWKITTSLSDWLGEKITAEEALRQISDVLFEMLLPELIGKGGE